MENNQTKDKDESESLTDSESSLTLQEIISEMAKLSSSKVVVKSGCVQITESAKFVVIKLT